MLPNYINENKNNVEKSNFEKYSIDTSDIDKAMSKLEKDYFPVDLFDCPFYYDMDLDLKDIHML